MSKVYLIPNVLSDGSDISVMAPYVREAIVSVRCFFVEEEKAARRLLKKLNREFPIDECVFLPLNEHTSFADARKLFEQVSDKDIGIISEAGCPCVADPGADIVSLAHRKGKEVIPLVGPSAVVLALMGSGLNGQNFAFHGYLPKDREEQAQRLKGLEKRSFNERQTQIFMETPYRNQSLFHHILASCQPETLLTVAVDLTGLDQSIKTLPIKEWQRLNPSLPKKPALFLIQKR